MAVDEGRDLGDRERADALGREHGLGDDADASGARLAGRRGRRRLRRQRIAGRHQREPDDGYRDAGHEERPGDEWLEVGVLRHEQDHVVAPQPRPRHRAAGKERPGEDAPVAPQQPERRPVPMIASKTARWMKSLAVKIRNDADLDPEQEGKGRAPSSSGPSPGEPKGDCPEDQDAQQRDRDRGR